MEEVLRALYKLQQIDLELDELNEGSADLPGEVQELEQRIASLQTSVDTEENRLHDLRRRRNESQEGIEGLRERVRSLNERLRTVRNNKEYEATTHEIAAAEADLQTTERSLVTMDTEQAQTMRAIETIRAQKEESAAELEEKSSTLRVLHETHADEIGELRNGRKDVLGHISDELMQKYNHIRTAYAEAVVRVRKGACSGCYRAITPQTIVEMRRNEQLFLCEHCGRILVDEETVASVSA